MFYYQPLKTVTGYTNLHIRCYFLPLCTISTLSRNISYNPVQPFSEFGVLRVGRIRVSAQQSVKSTGVSTLEIDHWCMECLYIGRMGSVFNSDVWIYV